MKTTTKFTPCLTVPRRLVVLFRLWGVGIFDVMNGTHTMQSIPPYCKEIKTEVEIVEWRGHRVLMRDLGMKAKGVDYLIEDDLGSVVLHIEGKD